MIHFMVSFFYVMAGTAAAIVLPQLFGWARADFTAVGAIVGVLAAANIHFLLVQSERVRRGLHGLEQIQSQLRALETRTADLDREASADRANVEQHIGQTVGEVKLLHELLQRFLGTAAKHGKKARLEAMVSAKAPPTAPLPRGPRGPATPRHGHAEPEEFSLRDRRR